MDDWGGMIDGGADGIRLSPAEHYDEAMKAFAALPETTSAGANPADVVVTLLDVVAHALLGLLRIQMEDR